MQRRHLSGRRAKEAASRFIHEVAGKKKQDANNMASKQVV